MREQDIIELVLATAKQQMNIVDKRDDEIVHILKSVSETTTTTDALSITKYAHPVKYDEAHAIYDRCSYA